MDFIEMLPHTVFCKLCLLFTQVLTTAYLFRATCMPHAATTLVTQLANAIKVTPEVELVVQVNLNLLKRLYF